MLKGDVLGWIAMTAAQKCILGVILLSYFVLSAVYNVGQPMWEAPDEPAHFGFVRYLQVHHALPTGDPNGPAHLDAWNPTAEYLQPPLYYVVLAAILAPIWLPPDAEFHQNPYVAWPGHPWREAVALHRTDEGFPYRGLSLFLHLGRLVSAGFGLIALLATFALVWTVTNRIVDGIFATAWLAWAPGFLLASARLNNDAAAMATGALTLFVCARLLVTTPAWRGADQETPLSSPAERAGGVSIRLVAVDGCLPMVDLLALTVGLSGALLSKLDNAFLIPLAMVAVSAAGWRSYRKTRSLRSLVLPLAAVVVPVVLLLIWWVVIGRTFDARMETSAGAGVTQFWNLVVGTPPLRVFGAIWNWNATWWGGIGWGMLTLWPPQVYAALAVPFFGLALLGAGSTAEGAFWRRERAARLTSLMVMATALPLLYFTVARQALPAINLDSNARYTLPIAPTIALAVVLGGRRIPFGRLRRPFAVGYLGTLLVVAIATAVVLLPEIPAPEIPARLAQNAGELTAAPIAGFSNGVDLVATSGLPDWLPAGGNLSFGLRWRVDSSPSSDFVVYTHLVDLNDRSNVAGADEIPYQGRFPPHLWQAGELVDEPRQLSVPGELKPGVYSLVVGAYVLKGNTPEAIAGSGASADGTAVEIRRWSVLPDTADLKSATPTQARFGDDLTLRGYHVRSQSGTLDVSLYWEATRPISRDLVVSVQTIGSSGKLVSQQDGAPVNGRLPTPDWPAETVIRDDRALSVPVADGPVRLIVVVYDRQTLKRLPVTAPGKPSADYFPLGP